MIVLELMGFYLALWAFFQGLQSKSKYQRDRMEEEHSKIMKDLDKILKEMKP